MPQQNRLIGASLSPVTTKFKKAKGRWHLRRRPFVLFTDLRRSIYDVTSHQFLLTSLKIKNARLFSSSNSHNSLIPNCLPFVENSL